MTSHDINFDSNDPGAVAGNIQDQLRMLSYIDGLGNRIFPYLGVEVEHIAGTTYNFQITFAGASSGADQSPVTYVDIGLLPATGASTEIQKGVINDYVFEVTFQGEVHDTAMSTALHDNNLTMAPIKEVQTLYVDAITDGWFALGFGDNTTDDMHWDSASPGSLAGTIGNMLEGAGADDVDVVYLGPDASGSERYEVTFGGDDAGEDQPDITQASAQNHAMPDDPIFTGNIWSTEDVKGMIPPAPPPWIPLFTAGDVGTLQTAASIGMQPDGDFVMVWMQYERHFYKVDARISGLPGQGQSGCIMLPESPNVNIYYRQFNESTDTAGPMVTDFLLPDGDRLSDGGQVIDPLQYIVVTFDEAMMTDGVHDVTDPQNWVLLQDDVAVLGGIADIQYGMNMASELAVPYGLYAVGSNKWEAVITLDGNGVETGITPLLDGHYEIVARNSLRDAAGNPLGRTGFEINGEDSGRRFDVVIPTGSEIRVNGQTAGDQETFPHSPQATAADADGDYVVVWTSDLPGAEGVYAKMWLFRF